MINLDKGFQNYWQQTNCKMFKLVQSAQVKYSMCNSNETVCIYQNIRILRYQNIEISKYWDILTLRYHNNELKEYQDDKILR